MAKNKTKWICGECGYETPKYLGKCPDCGAWSSFVEEVESIPAKNNNPLGDVMRENGEAVSVNHICLNESIRFSTGFCEFDRVLGGGAVQGSVILLAGDPGTGKSTLVLQSAKTVCKSGRKVLYVCAEESASQVKLRADRLKVKAEELYIYSQIEINRIKEEIERIKPECVIIDSIQAVYSSEIPGSAGSISQIRECCNIFTEIAKSKNITTIITGHVTKDGSIAGPKVAEHTVDTVLYFESDRYKTFRILRCIKNRFGPTDETGIFVMTESGLEEVKNPNEIYLNERSRTETSGSTFIMFADGNRILAAEVQALTVQTGYPAPKRIAVGTDYNRLLQIIAVTEKRIGLNFGKSDIYVNITGGTETDDPGADLGIALAIITAARDVVVSPDTIIIGEIGLSGEIRKVTNIEKRIAEAQKTGFKRVIIPALGLKSKDKFEIEIIEVSKLSEAVSKCVYKEKIKS